MLGQLVKNLKIEGIDSKGNAYGHFAGGRILVDKAVPGDVADVQALRLTKGDQPVFRGRILNIVEPSALRIDPFCKHFMHCGGCQWQHVSYSNQLKLKRNQIEALFSRHIPAESVIPEVIASPDERRYRNKIVFSFSNRRWLTPEEKSDPTTILRPAAGYIMRGKYDHALEIHQCEIAPESAIRILQLVRDTALEHRISFYDMRKERGVLRQLLVRYGADGQLLIGIVFAEFDRNALELLAQTLQSHFQEIKSICYFLNPKKDGNISELTPVHFTGEKSIPVRLNGLEFEMRPGSFFQTNTRQTEQLYHLTSEWCGLTGKETVLDLYSGTGTIALTVARKADKVLGIEFVEEAVLQAEENARRNKIGNVKFLAGDLKDVLRLEEVAAFGTPDVVITDPPRAGMHREVNQALLQMLPKRIIYISCNPVTQERDTRILGNHYKLLRIQPFDMFPHTVHVENVILLQRRDV